MRLITAGSSMHAITFKGPPQVAQVSSSILNTRSVVVPMSSPRSALPGAPPRAPRDAERDARVSPVHAEDGWVRQFMLMAP